MKHGQKSGSNTGKRFDVMPSRHHSVPLTKQQAFALTVAATVPSDVEEGFAAEIDALWG